MPLRSASFPVPVSALYRGHAVYERPLGWYGVPLALNTNTCAPPSAVSAVCVVVATTSMLPSPSRSAAASPRTSGALLAVVTSAGHPDLIDSAPAFHS